MFDAIKYNFEKKEAKTLWDVMGPEKQAEFIEGWNSYSEFTVYEKVLFMALALRMNSTFSQEQLERTVYLWNEMGLLVR